MKIIDEPYSEYKKTLNICINCRKPLDRDFDYCPYCGTKSTLVEDNEETIAFLFRENNYDA